jgi:aryl-alcohol dehydrogenase-like predicted oxidoreductase
MDYRYLGRSGFRVPALSLGTATFGGKGASFAAWGDAQAEQATRLVDMCLDFGLNMFDSADVYSAGPASSVSYIGQNTVPPDENDQGELPTCAV